MNKFFSIAIILVSVGFLWNLALIGFFTFQEMCEKRT